MFSIVVDSTSCTTPDELKEMNVILVPLNTRFGEESFIDGVEMPSDKFYERMAIEDELPQTNCPAPHAFEVAFREGCENTEGTLCLTISSGVSGTYNSACVGRDTAAADGLNIVVLDSKSTTQDLSSLLAKAVEMRDAGASLDETVAHLKKMVQASLTYYALDTVENLEKGGRMPADKAEQATALKIKPIIHLEREAGQVRMGTMSRGTKGMLADLVELVKAYVAENGETVIKFSHGAAPERVEKVRAALAEAGIECEPGMGWIGSVIGTYTGPRAVGVSMMPKSLI